MGIDPDIIGSGSEPLDIGAIRAEEWPHRQLTPLPRKRKRGFQVIFQDYVLRDIHTHGQSITDMEICGLLIGHVYRDEHGPFLHIIGAVEGRHATHHAAQVTFTSATWEYAHDVLEREYPDQRIVGWYHTHPDFGIFLSGMDLFIQENFFNLPWQVAFVYDPIRREEGLFAWKDGKSERVDYLVHSGGYVSGREEPTSEPAVVDKTEAPALAGTISPPAPEASELNPIVRGDSRWQRLRKLMAGFVHDIEGQWTGQWRDRS